MVLKEGGRRVSWVKAGVEKHAAGSGQCTGAGGSRCLGGSEQTESHALGGQEVTRGRAQRAGNVGATHGSEGRKAGQ